MDITLLQASDLIKNGAVIAVPTETVYGLAASLISSSAIDKIFALKGRPANNPLIIHVADYEEILPFIYDVDADFFKLSQNFWPGPLTIVLPIIEGKISSRVTAGLKTAAFRIPNHPLARKLLKLTGPLVMPSANLSGKPSATCREHVEADFGNDFPVLDGGACIKGLESTILYRDTDQKWKIIRQGALAQGDFYEILGYLPEIEKPKNHEKPICPGQLYRHYAPRATLVLKDNILESYQGVIVGFEGRTYPVGCKVYLMGNLDDAESISKKLYCVLRKLDDDGVQEALVDIDFAKDGIFSTILERLQKASSK